MIHLYDIKPCSDFIDTVQVEGLICQDNFSIDPLEQILADLGFKIFSVGNPIVLICRRLDCLFLINSDGSFNLSEVKTKEKLLEIVQEIDIQITSKKER